MKEEERWEKSLCFENKLDDLHNPRLSRTSAAHSVGNIRLYPSSIFSSMPPSKVRIDRNSTARKSKTIPTEELTREVNKFNIQRRKSKDDSITKSMDKIPFPITNELPSLKATSPVSTTINALERFLM